MPFRDGTFALKVKKSLGFERGFQAQKLLVQLAFTFGLNEIDRELIRPLRLVDGDATMRFDCHAILQVKTQTRRILLPHHTFQGSVLIFECEINMTRCRARQVGNLPFHPHILQGWVVLQLLANVEGQLGDSQVNGGKEGRLHWRGE